MPRYMTTKNSFFVNGWTKMSEKRVIDREWIGAATVEIVWARLETNRIYPPPFVCFLPTAENDVNDKTGGALRMSPVSLTTSISMRPSLFYLDRNFQLKFVRLTPATASISSPSLWLSPRSRPFPTLREMTTVTASTAATTASESNVSVREEPFDLAHLATLQSMRNFISCGEWTSTQRLKKIRIYTAWTAKTMKRNQMTATRGVFTVKLLKHLIDMLKLYSATIKEI